MSFSSMLRRFGPVATFIAIRSAVVEPYFPRPSSPMHDPWWQADMDYATAYAYVPEAVSA